MKTTRRGFVRSVGAGALFAILPRDLVAGGGTPPSERVNVAAIGCGGRALQDISGCRNAGARIVAMCDVDLKRAEGERKRHPEVPFFRDWREMLDKTDKDADAVIIGVPDHWHATMAVECLERGKHVQCEKPLCQSFHEMDGMVAAAKAHPRLVTQAMNQGHAYDTIRDFREWIEAGLIGEVTEVHIWAPAVYSFVDSLDDLKKTWPVPETLDWERWQGPVPHRPYCPKYCPGNWRKWTAYGSSSIGDWSCHLMDPVFWTFGLDMPKTVKAEPYGIWSPEKHAETFPKGAKTTFEYVTSSGRPLKFVWFDGEACKDVPRPDLYKDAAELFPPTMTRNTARKVREGMPNGAFVHGTKGVIEYGHHGANHLRMLPDVTLEKLRADGAAPAAKYPRVQGGKPNDKPFVEFLDAIRGKGKVGSDFEYAGKMTKCALLGVAALFEPGRTLGFDAQSGRFVNGAAANARLKLPRVKG